MNSPTQTPLGNVLFIPHGGGPLPILGDKHHQEMVAFLKAVPQKLIKPSAIVVISAHWEQPQITITSAQQPPLIYDYYGFPDDAYNIQYPVKGSPVLAKKIATLLSNNGIKNKLDSKRGFDHGVFIPLKIMYPKATVPCVQVSLLNNLSPQQHIKLGQALATLKQNNVLIIGSGLSFHNMSAFFDNTVQDNKNEQFEQWLINTCTNNQISTKERLQKLSLWQQAPHANYCHPREEHLLPLMVCAGITKTPAKLVFNNKVLGKKVSAYLWA